MATGRIDVEKQPDKSPTNLPLMLDAHKYWL